MERTKPRLKTPPGSLSHSSVLKRLQKTGADARCLSDFLQRDFAHSRSRFRRSPNFPWPCPYPVALSLSVTGAGTNLSRGKSILGARGTSSRSVIGDWPLPQALRAFGTRKPKLKAAKS